MRTASHLHDDYDNFIVAEDLDRRAKRYHYFSSVEEFEKSRHLLSNNLYEVIKGPQRLYFDIDSDVELDLTPLLEKLQNPTVYTSHRPGKYSYHVLDKRYVNDNLQCKHQVTKIRDLLPEPLKSKIDMDVYRRYQLLRLLGCSKYGIDCVKIGPGTLKESLVENIEGCTLIEDEKTPVTAKDIRFQARELGRLLA
jgi:hypothetical protein